MASRRDEREKMSDHDLLVRLDERVEKLDHCLSNHLKHHWAITIAIVAALVGTLSKILHVW